MIIFNVFLNECMVVFKVCIAKKICPRDFNVILAINHFCAQNYVSNVVDVLPGVLSKKEKKSSCFSQQQSQAEPDPTVRDWEASATRQQVRIS